MIDFIKRQFLKIIIYIVVIILINTLWLFSKWNISILGIFNSLITSLFTFIISKTWLEDYKLEINKELEKYKTKLSNYTLVTKLQYDLEFKIYTEIYEKMFSLYIETDKLMPGMCGIDYLTNENIEKRLKGFFVIYNETSNLINKYRPFYSKEIYEILKKTRDICFEESVATESSIQKVGITFNYAISMARKDQIRENLEKISNLIKVRIENMKIIED